MTKHIYSTVELEVANSVIFFLFQGATIKAEESTGRILIARVMHGGAADRSGLISVGDEVKVFICLHYKV